MFYLYYTFRYCPSINISRCFITKGHSSIIKCCTDCFQGQIPVGWSCGLRSFLSYTWDLKTAIHSSSDSLNGAVTITASVLVCSRQLCWPFLFLLAGQGLSLHQGTEEALRKKWISTLVHLLLLPCPQFVHFCCGQRSVYFLTLAFFFCRTRTFDCLVISPSLLSAQPVRPQ